jgi:hypothetical protein
VGFNPPPPSDNASHRLNEAPRPPPPLNVKNFDTTTGDQYSMRDAEFAWDVTKAETNWRRHGVTFDMARGVFRDPFAIEWSDISANLPPNHA